MLRLRGARGEYAQYQLLTLIISKIKNLEFDILSLFLVFGLLFLVSLSLILYPLTVLKFSPKLSLRTAAASLG